MTWAAPQDMMCEPFILNKTGLDVIDHQTATVDNFIELRSIAPEVPWIPVLQGFSSDDYIRCIDMYYNAGINLNDFQVTGLGSVCRRQATEEIIEIVERIINYGIIRLHGFGVKQTGLMQLGGLLTSCDSMAWSYNARYKRIRLPHHYHENCANCMIYAIDWRREMLDRINENP